MPGLKDSIRWKDLVQVYRLNKGIFEELFDVTEANNSFSKKWDDGMFGQCLNTFQISEGYLIEEFLMYSKLEISFAWNSFQKGQNWISVKFFDKYCGGDCYCSLSWT